MRTERDGIGRLSLKQREFTLYVAFLWPSPALLLKLSTPKGQLAVSV